MKNVVTIGGGTGSFSLLTGHRMMRVMEIGEYENIILDVI